jgi:hypothetical protein
MASDNYFVEVIRPSIFKSKGRLSKEKEKVMVLLYYL